MSKQESKPKNESASAVDALVIGTNNDAEIELAQIADMRGLVTTFHWNDDFLRWWENNYPDKKLCLAQRRLRYYANKLVKKGFLKPCERIGTGIGGESTFGVNTQSIWRRKYQ